MKATSKLNFRAIGCSLGILVILLGSVSCSQQLHQGLLPKDVVGEWITDDPRYKDRVMELSQAFVIIVTGRKEPASVQMIDRVQTGHEGSETLFSVFSTDYSQGTHFEMKLQFSPANGGEIRFHNQSAVWKRQPATQNKPAKLN